MTHSALQPESVVMIVDDTPVNMRLLSDFLESNGYSTQAFPSGRKALAAAARRAPDLILLDITMPEMDGYEVCAHLKADPALADIPVIFISALSDAEDKVRAFTCGGVDYISKPFKAEEVLARVQAHLNLRRLQRELAERNRQLEAALGDRTALTAMIVHDLGNLLTIVLGGGELLQRAAGDLRPPQRECLSAMLVACDDMLYLTNGLLHVDKLESGQWELQLESVSVRAVLAERAAVARAQTNAPAAGLALEVADGLRCWADTRLLSRVLDNLLSNARKFCPPDGRIRLSASADGAQAVLVVANDGPVIPPEFQTRMFDKFTQQLAEGQAKRRGVGLGLAFCRLAVTQMGGTVEVCSPLPGETQGTAFVLRLPMGSPGAHGAS